MTTAEIQASKEIETDRSQHSAQFVEDSQRPFATLVDESTVELLNKWGLNTKQSMVLRHFTYDAQTIFRRGIADSFLCDLFNSPEFRSSMMLSDGHGKLYPFSHPNKVTKVNYTALDARVTTLDMFDRLQNDQIVRQNGKGICRMMDVYLPCGITVSDQLRGLFMLGDESEFACEELFSEREKNEFLYHIMWRLLAGGALNQYEDDFSVYKDVCRSLYRDMISVVKNATTGELEVQTVVYQVHAASGDAGPLDEVPLFPKDDQRGNCNYMYVAVHPARQFVSVWYNGFWSPF